MPVNRRRRPIEIITHVRVMQKAADHWRQSKRTIALVPTMGFLHEGHLSLMREGKKAADELVVSIFVNPTQFGPEEDFAAYPRDINRDIDLCRKEGVDAIFNPEASELYTDRFQTYVELEKLPDHLCGLSRPVHFRGAATVVSKLFNIIKPHAAIFGEKDFQQLAVIRRMVIDLNFDIRIIGASTVRESDGLAMSSRNKYLSKSQRIVALSLYQALKEAQIAVSSGVKNAGDLIRQAADLISARPETQIDYISICDTETLDPVDQVGDQALMALAVYVGKTRLIDNIILKS